MQQYRGVGVDGEIRQGKAFADAAKRGGGRVLLSLDDETNEDRYLREPASDLSPEKIYEARNNFV